MSNNTPGIASAVHYEWQNFGTVLRCATCLTFFSCSEHDIYISGAFFAAINVDLHFLEYFPSISICVA